MSRPADLLRLDRPLNRDTVRLYAAHLNRARRALKHPDDEAVHTARKAIKRSRSLLRLLRGALTRERYAELDCGLRAVGRRTGPLRDAAVACALTRGLRAEGVLSKGVAARLQSALTAYREEARDTLASGGGPEALRADLKALRLTRDDTAAVDVLTLHDGLVGTYARGRGRLARSLAVPTDDELHAWRRQVKHHGVHLRLLIPAWPDPIRGAVRAVGDLSDALGDDHDLAELNQRAAEAGLSSDDRAALRSATAPLREALQADAWSHGVRVFAEPPAALGARLTAYLVAGLDDARGAPLPPLNGWALSMPRPLWRIDAAALS